MADRAAAMNIIAINDDDYGPAGSKLRLVNADAAWPANHIDWEAAADALLIDYTEVDFAGETYYIRS